MKIELSREQLEYVLHLLHNREKTLNKRTSEKADFELLKIDGICSSIVFDMLNN